MVASNPLFAVLDESRVGQLNLRAQDILAALSGSSADALRLLTTATTECRYDRLTANSDYAGVHSDIVALLERRRAAARSVNALMTATYWEIGRRIVELEEIGQGRAGYGEALLNVCPPIF